MIRRHRRSTKRFAVLWLIPLLIISVGYAGYSQQLSVHTIATKPAYSSSNNLDISYTSAVIAKAGKWQFTLSPFKVINQGPADVSSWQVSFTVPAGATNLSCTGANCSLSGTTITITNTTGAGTILAGSSHDISVVFRLAQNAYVLQNIAVSGTEEPIFRTMAGLTVATTAGTRVKQGNKYTTPFTFTITNNSGQNLSAVRLRIPWDTATNTVISMPAGLSYYVADSELIMVRSTALNSGQSATYTVSLSSTSQTWTISSATVEGNV